MPRSIHFDYLLPLSEFLTVLGFLLALVLLAHLIRSNRPPQSTIAWLLTIVMIPYLGVPLYLMFGGRKMRRLMSSKGMVYDRAGGRRESEFGSGTERILCSFGVPPASTGNTTRVVTHGVEAYQELIRLIEEAQHSIHVTTYILANDPVGEAIVTRLARRAADGLDVRILLDSVGSWRLRRRFLAPFQAAGGRVAYFMPVIHIPFRGRSNLRNHRKIIIADGRAAITGGMNIANEYLGPVPDPSRWRDISVMVEGPAAGDLEQLFWSDWSFATDEAPPLATHHGPTVKPPGHDAVQVVASGPDVEGDPLYESLISLIFTARHRIWIVTPYFVPDEILARALSLAARRGVDVRLMIPNHSNHRSADLARVGYLRQVHQSGGKILRYRPGMLHAKAILIDDEVAVVGSANMDMRSLFLNYEVSLFIYDSVRVREIEAWFQSLSAGCRNGLTRPNWAREIGENIVRLLSPLL